MSTRSGALAGQTSISEVEKLKKQKIELLEERKRLKERIARIDEESQRPIRASINPRLIFQLDQEYKTLQEGIEAKKKELAELRMSDEIVVRQELQEEIKALYLERVRLQGFQIEQQQELNKVRAEYEDLLNEESQEVIDKQEQKLDSYKEKLDKYKKANHKLAGKIKSMRANKAFADDKGRAKIEERAQELKLEIEKVQQETESVKLEIEQSRKDHRLKMRELRTQVTKR